MKHMIYNEHIPQGGFRGGESTLFQRTFGAEPRVFAFDAIWQRITPERPPEYGQPCPDCGSGRRSDALHE